LSLLPAITPLNGSNSLDQCTLACSVLAFMVPPLYPGFERLRVHTVVRSLLISYVYVSSAYKIVVELSRTVTTCSS